jgi:hypothetical protein
MHNRSSIVNTFTPERITGWTNMDPFVMVSRLMANPAKPRQLSPYERDALKKIEDIRKTHGQLSDFFQKVDEANAKKTKSDLKRSALAYGH